MITVTYNERKQSVEENLTLAKLLELEGIDPQEAQGIAIAHNHSVIPRNQWMSLLLEDGDQIDVLQAIQGG